MRDRAIDLLADALVAVRTRPGRAALSALGIALAIATFLLVTGIPAAGQAAVERRLAALGADVLVAEAQRGDDGPALLPAASAAMVERIGPVTTAASVANLSVPVLRTRFADRTTTAGISALAVDGDLLRAVRGHVASGTALGPAESALPCAVLGATAARWLGITDVGPAHPVEVLVGGRSFTVVGVLAAMPLAPELEQAVLVGRASAVAQLGLGAQPSVVYLRAAESQLDAVQTVLPRTLSPGLPGLVAVTRPSDALAAKRITTSAFSALVLGMAGVALVVGGVGISNTMVVAVLERRREVGVRRALGAGRRQIAAQFLVEAVVLAGLGAVAGAVVGLAATAAYAALHGWPVVLPWPTTGAAVLGALIVGAIAGLSPALRAARVSPTEALAAP